MGDVFLHLFCVSHVLYEPPYRLLLDPIVQDPLIILHQLDQSLLRKKIGLTQRVVHEEVNPLRRIHLIGLVGLDRDLQKPVAELDHLQVVLILSYVRQEKNLRLEHEILDICDQLDDLHAA